MSNSSVQLTINDYQYSILNDLIQQVILVGLIAIIIMLIIIAVSVWENNKNNEQLKKIIDDQSNKIQDLTIKISKIKPTSDPFGKK
jgi:NADH:ubiquinone oxidoreductase subunit 6 (subunit J)